MTSLAISFTFWHLHLSYILPLLETSFQAAPNVLLGQMEMFKVMDLEQLSYYILNNILPASDKNWVGLT